MTALTEIVVPWASFVGLLAMAFGVGKWVSASRAADERQELKQSTTAATVAGHGSKLETLDSAREDHATRLTKLESRTP